MNKYIDADSLRAEINKTINEIVADALDPDAGIEAVASAKYKKDALSNVLNIIDSLQEEQPDFPTTDEEIEMLLATHPKVEVPNKYKTPDWLWKKQEQPVTAVGKVFTNPKPMNIIVENEQWEKLLGQFDNGQRVRIILVKEDAE